MYEMFKQRHVNKTLLVPYYANLVPLLYDREVYGTMQFVVTLPTVSSVRPQSKSYRAPRVHRVSAVHT